MTYSAELSYLAKEDIGAILTYTRRHYGDLQCGLYAQVIYDTIESLTQNPDIGHYRPDIPPAYRAIGIGQHVVVYVVKEKTIFVARILHGSMKFQSRL